MIAIFVGNLVNLGDALIALRQATYLRARGHKVVILPHEGVSNELQNEFSSLGVKVLSIRNNPIRAMLLCFRAHLILGGGHMIREQVSVFWLLFCTLAFAASRAFGHRTLVAGVGATPVSSCLKKFLFRVMLVLSSTVYVRDPNSENMLKNLAPFCKTKIHLGGDMAYLGGSLKGRDTEGVCAISPAVDKSENRTVDFDEILNVLNKLKSEGLKRIILIPHDLRDDFDVLACQEIKNFLVGKIDVQIDICEVSTVSTGLIPAYESASWVITSRLHGLILSSLFGKQVFYTDRSAKKLKYFADFFGYISAKNYAYNTPDNVDAATALDGVLTSLSKVAKRTVAGF
ncbi:polysaccharide pyruvyl transferase family protein [Azotobacter chroococcum]|uniref:polysaccharide pyruvyl transferase family protein n=1 Tax=Azotobacter chroococcum TaxID=353 RepID=UPI000B77EB4F|nr:polysaccharide pyruvyl transferase family protein [Azotobacter chroococcum]